MIFNNGRFVGGFAGTKVGRPDAVRLGHQRHHAPRPLRHRLHGASSWRSALMVASMRRGRSGRRLLAVRTNERAAAALGISVPGAKIYAFAVSAGIAAVGGMLLGVPQGRHPLRHRVHQLHVDPRRRVVVHRRHRLPARSDLRLDAGARLARRAVYQRHLRRASAATSQLIGGVVVVLLVLQNQDGIAKESINQFAWVGRQDRAERSPASPDASPRRFVLPAEGDA